MNRCIICGRNLKNSKLKGLLSCENCNFITTNLNLSEDEIRQLYSQNYYNGEEYADYVADKYIIQKNFSKRLNRLERYVNDCSEKRVFEIGCAYGFFLQVAYHAFKEVAGIDISEDAVSFARNNLKMNAIAGDFLSYNLVEKQDVVCMWDTIEHLARPDLFIEKAYHCLKQDGVLCITTGDIGSWNARIRGRKWRQIHPPTHLHYFSQKTLKLLLKEKGFSVLNVSYPANMISLNTVLYTILCLKSRHKRLYQFLVKIGITKWNISINLYDYMYIIAKKE